MRKISYGGIVFPDRGRETGEILLTTVATDDGSLGHAIPKGGRNRKESDPEAAKREIEEETGVKRDALHQLLKLPIVQFAHHTKDGSPKLIVLYAFITSNCGPYAPKDRHKHPFAETVPIRRLSEFVWHPEDAMELVRLQSMLTEFAQRIKGIVTWNGFFAEHPKLAKEFDRNMEKFRRGR